MQSTETLTLEFQSLLRDFKTLFEQEGQKIILNPTALPPSPAIPSPPTPPKVEPQKITTVPKSIPPRPGEKKAAPPVEKVEKPPQREQNPWIQTFNKKEKDLDTVSHFNQVREVCPTLKHPNQRAATPCKTLPVLFFAATHHAGARDWIQKVQAALKSRQLSMEIVWVADAAGVLERIQSDSQRLLLIPKSLMREPSIRELYNFDEEHNRHFLEETPLLILEEPHLYLHDLILKKVLWNQLKRELHLT